jgi:hypothetical protein
MSSFLSSVAVNLLKVLEPTSDISASSSLLSLLSSYSIFPHFSGIVDPLSRSPPFKDAGSVENPYMYNILL